MLPNRIPRDASEVLSLVEKRLSRLELKGHGFVVPDAGEGITSYSQDDQPPDPVIEGSIWIDTNSGNTIYRYTNGVWRLALDPAIDQVRDEAAVAIVSVQDVEAYSDNKVILFYQATAPTTGTIGDLWVDSTSKQLYRWDGFIWVVKGTTELGINISRAYNLTAIADARVNTWWQFNPPIADGYGDLWVDTSEQDKPLYRWTNFNWQRVMSWTGPLYDELGNKISTYYQPTPPTSTAAGDIWYDTSNDNLPYRADTPGATTIGADQWIEVPAGTAAIADGAIDATKIQAQSITADLLESNLILSSAISTGQLDTDPTSPTYNELIGQRVEISPFGIRLVDESGQDIVTLPVDLDQTASFNGQITTSSLRVLGGTSIESTNNEIAKGGSLVLSNGVTAPNSGPTLINTYETVRMDTTTRVTGDLGTFAFDPAQTTAFAYDVQYNGWLVAQRRSGGTRIWRFAANGTIQQKSDGSARFGDYMNWLITGVTSRAGGTAVDYIGLFNDSWRISGELPGDLNSTIRNVFLRQNESTYPTLGYDTAANAYLVAETTATTDRINVRRFQMSPTRDDAPNRLSTINMDAGTGRDGSLSSIMYEPFDFGSNRYVYTARGNYGTAWALTSAGVASPNENFPTANANVIGFGYDSLNFWSLGNDGTLSKHSSWTWTDTKAKLFAGITYYDSDPTGGTHETNLGQVTGITRRKRSLIMATLPAVPDHGGANDPDRWRLYTALATSTVPVTTAFHLQATGIGATPDTPGTLLLSGTTEIGVAPPVTNGFPAANPAYLYSSAEDADGSPLIMLMGDGSGRMGPYSWAAGEVDSGWVDLTPAAGFTFSGSVRCRKIGKLVEVEVYSITNDALINVSANGAVLDQVLATVPVGYRPAGNVRVGGMVGRGAWFVLATSGSIILSAADASGTAWDITANTPMSCHFMYYVN